jgi:signal transduction histidine kinase
MKEIKTIARFSSIINSSLDIDDVLSNSMLLIEELMEADVCSIFELDREKNELFFRLARYDPHGNTKKIRIKMGEGIVGSVASTGEMITVLDTKKDDRFNPMVDSITGFQTKSIVAVPIKNKGRILGVIQVLNCERIASLDEDMLEVLFIVAGQVGIAMENARLYGRLKENFALTKAELKETQAKLLRSERLAAMGQLSHAVAHEVRNPVMAIGGFARRLKKMLPSDQPSGRYIDVILQETARLGKMVVDVEQCTSLPEPELKQVNLSDLLKSAVYSWKKKQKEVATEVKIKSMSENPEIYVDKELMKEALIRVLSNAQESMAQKGVITISTWWEGRWVIISIRDHGIGIVKDDLPRVFEPFFTSKMQGAGLGLFFVSQIVAGHGGEVKISSTRGVGTEVRICFPATSPLSQWR